jgi:signal peptidase I
MKMPRRRPRRPQSFARRLVRNVLLFALGVGISAALCFGVSCRAYRVGTDSMAPTLRQGNAVLVATFLAGHMPRRGDVVLLHTPQLAGGATLAARRVVGLPGDVLQVREGRLWRNGKLTEEPYLRESMTYAWGPVRCSDGYVLVLSDNRTAGGDSHDWIAKGTDGKPSPAPEVSITGIAGRIFWVLFPPHLIPRIKDQ